MHHRHFMTVKLSYLLFKNEFILLFHLSNDDEVLVAAYELNFVIMQNEENQ